MVSNRPGDVLAGRYRLADLLSEACNGRFWYAHDLVLGRPVAVHVIAAEDERAPRLFDAARTSATIADTRLLRVLDADERDGQVYVVNEWGSGTSVDHLLADSGPVSARRAAWITAEVAETIATAHAAGHAHGRLNPENVLLDHAGGVRVIGFAVDAALHGLRRDPSDAMTVDLDDLGGLLHALLTGKWAGVSESVVPRVPVAHGRVLRPRQVRAGVPRVLDDLCDRILSGSPPPAGALASQLREYVGDDSDLLGTPPAGPVPASFPIDLDPVADPPAPEQTQIRTPEPEPTPEPDAAPDPGPPTEAAVPVFDDDTGEEGPWYAPRADTPAPPPELEEPPARPLFADEPRVPRYEAPPEPEAAHPEYDQADSWPFASVAPTVDVAEEPRRVPGRNWLRLALGIGLGIVLVVGAAYGYHAWDSSRSAAPESTPTPSGTASPTPSAAPISGVTAQDYDPLGTPLPSEYPELVHYVLDGKAATSWHTSTYNDQFGPRPPALKSGVGLVLDLHGTYSVSQVRVDVGDLPGTAVSVYVGADPPSGVPTGAAAARASGRGSLTLTPATPATGRYVLVWLTRLPAVAGGYRGEVAEVSVAGTAAAR